MKDYINHKPKPQIHWTNKARVISELLIAVVCIPLVLFLFLGG